MNKHSVVIEMSAGDVFKFEILKASPNVLMLDRAISVPIPQNYGFITNTLATDKDQLDAFIISSRPLPRLCQVSLDNLVLLGAYVCEDGGVLDEKLIFKIKGDKVSSFEIENESIEIERYLRTYKQGFRVIKYVGEVEAKGLITKYAR